jgi:hypothetical protein
MSKVRELLEDIIVKVGTMLSFGVDKNTARYHVLKRIADADLAPEEKIRFGAKVNEVIDKVESDEKTEEEKEKVDIEDRIAHIIVEVGAMIAAGVDNNTIRFYVLTHVGKLPESVSGLEKMVLIGTLEQTIEKLGREINLR